MLTISIPLNSTEIRQSKGAQEAIDKEIKQLHDKKALNFSVVHEWKDIVKWYPNARRCKGRMLISKKGVERAEGFTWKGRFVAGGHDIRDAYGKRIYEVLRHQIPASLTGIMLGIVWQLLVPNGITLSGDVPGA